MNGEQIWGANMGSKYGENQQLALYRLAGECQIATNLVSGVRNRTVQVYVLSGSTLIRGGNETTFQKRDR